MSDFIVCCFSMYTKSNTNFLFAVCKAILGRTAVTPLLTNLIFFVTCCLLMLTQATTITESLHTPNTTYCTPYIDLKNPRNAGT